MRRCQRCAKSLGGYSPKARYCSDACRSAAWKDKRGYGYPEVVSGGSESDAHRSNGRSQGGLQVSYRKAVEAVAASIMHDRSHEDCDFCRYVAERALRQALPMRQRDRLEPLEVPT